MKVYESDTPTWETRWSKVEQFENDRELDRLEATYGERNLEFLAMELGMGY